MFLRRTWPNLTAVLVLLLGIGRVNGSAAEIVQHIIRPDGVGLSLSGIDVDQDVTLASYEVGLWLITPSFPGKPHVKGYESTVVVVDNRKVVSIASGEGNALPEVPAVPANGYVLIGSGIAHEFLAALREGDDVSVVSMPRMKTDLKRNTHVSVKVADGFAIWPITGFDSSRGPEELIVYTSEFGTHTHTNEWGIEAVVIDGKVTSIRRYRDTGLQAIPENGYVLSGHGAARDWIERTLAVGDTVELISLKEGSMPLMLAHLRTDHPRLYATPEDFQRIKTLIEAGDPLVLEWFRWLKADAERILQESESAYEIPDGRRLWAMSRQVLTRVQTLAMMYRIEGDDRYLERAWRELAAAAKFPDWNPRHFLDTAEMTHAFAVGYDWLFDAWTEEQRAVLREALIEKGLLPALAAYRGTSPREWRTWVEVTNNWNPVVNGGITLGALAIADEEPELAAELIQSGLRLVPRSLEGFAPDGAWIEGVGYWHYTVMYLVPYLTALENALGHDFGLSQAPGLSEAGYFPIYMTSPIGEVFNFADGNKALVPAPELFWFAQKYGNPAYAWWQTHAAGRTAPVLNLLWYRPELSTGFSPHILSLDGYFRGVEAVALRSHWDDANAVFVAFKAGDNTAPHGDLDLGSFVLDALGTRWAEELGADNYNLPGFFNVSQSGDHWLGQRWTYYRKRAEGQNTLVINPDDGPDQDPYAVGEIVFYSSQSTEAIAIADITAGYAHHVRRVQRGIALFDERRQVLIQDEVSGDKPFELWWFMHTAAEIDISHDGTTAILSKDGKKLMVRLLSPDNRRFQVLDPRPLPTSPNPPGQNLNTNIRKLAVRIQNVTDLRLAVQFTPIVDDHLVTGSATIIPLSEWKERAQNGVIWSSFPHIELNILSPKRGDSVSGHVPVVVHLKTPVSVEIQGLSVYLGGEVVYRGPQTSDSLLIDTRPFADGRHMLEVRAHLTSGDTLTAMHPIRVENLWRIQDDFVPPLEAAWFGTIDRSKTYAVSPGWSYATDDHDRFFGDATRRVRIANTTEYLIWETPNLAHFHLTVYASKEGVQEVLLLEVSETGQTWVEVPFSVHQSSRGDWILYDLQGEPPRTLTVNYFRLTVQEGAFLADEIQLGRAEFQGRH